MPSSLFPTRTHKSYFNCLNWNPAILKCIPTKDLSSRSAAAHPGSEDHAILPNISPSQAWVDMTAAEDMSLIQIRRKCFLRRTSIICQALFFSFLPYLLCTKAAVVYSTGCLYLTVLSQIRRVHQQQLCSTFFYWFRGQIFA